MNAKKMTLVLALVSVAAAGAFANGTVDQDSTQDGTWGPRAEQGFRGQRRSGGRPMGGPSAQAYGEWDMTEWETETYEGVLTIIEGEAPLLTTADGDSYRLMIRYPVAAEDVPENGSVVTIEGVEMPHRVGRDLVVREPALMVLGATVNGVEIEADWSEGCEWGYGRMGMWGGRGGFGPGGRFGGFVPENDQ